jgi:hypothetical protein
MRIARVFPRKTNMTPDDELVFTGPPTVESMAMEIDAVHISVTFTWDLEKAEELYESWQMLGVPVEVGGPAFDDRMGDFTPGMYVKKGLVFTSRGCSKDCWFCSVPRCSKGIVRELPIKDGYNIMDDNILGTSEGHFRAVIEMLKRQKERPVFSGGLEPAFLQPWHAELLKEVNPKRMYTAYDTKDDYEAIRQMAERMWDAGFSKAAQQVKCYCLCGYPGDSFEEAEKRMKQIMDVGFLPFAMLFRDESGSTEKDWRVFQREWCNSITVGRKFSEYTRKAEEGPSLFVMGGG